MVRRLMVSALWFVALFCLHEVAWSVLGSPRLLGLLIGGLGAAFVWADPFHLSRVTPTSRPDARTLDPGFEPR